MSDNPYQAPDVVAVASEGGGADPTLDGAVDMLRQTKPWVRFMSVMMFVGSAFMVLGGLLMMVGGIAGPSQGLGVAIGIAYIFMALFYIMPGVFLWKYADRIGVFMRERSTGTLTSALEAQKSFWKFVGIIMLIIVVLYGVGIAFAIIAGIVASVG